MRIVTIAAGHACREHPALLERAVIVDLVEHLSVGMVEPTGVRGETTWVSDSERPGTQSAMNFSAAMQSAARLAIVAR